MESREDYLHNRLIRLADMMESEQDADDQSFYKELSREYRAITKELFPDMVTTLKIQQSTKLRKPSKKFLGTLAICSCGQACSWGLTLNNLQKNFSCPACNKQGASDVNLSKARDNWNAINRPKLK